jgi:hypothetical protein
LVLGTVLIVISVTGGVKIKDLEATAPNKPGRYILGAMGSAFIFIGAYLFYDYHKSHPDDDWKAARDRGEVGVMTRE